MENVVIQTAFLGDVLLTIPLLKRLKKTNPKIPVVLVCRTGLEDSLAQLKIANRVIGWNKGDAVSERSLVQELKKLKIDNLLVPHRSLRTALLVRKVQARRKIGFRRWWNNFFFTDRVIYQSQFPDAIRQWSLLEPMDITIARELLRFSKELKVINPLQKSDLVFDKWIEANDLSMTVEVEKSSDPFVIGALAVAPGSVWNTKRWTEQGFVELCRNLTQLGRRVILLGSASERELCDRIVNGVGAPSDQLRSYAGKTSVFEMVKILKSCALAITNDSGAMHLASVANTPVVSIFGPTVLAIGYRPWSDKAMVVQRDLSCRPCGKHGSNKCPLGTHACMKEITADQILKGCQAVFPEAMRYNP